MAGGAAGPGACTEDAECVGGMEHFEMCVLSPLLQF